MKLQTAINKLTKAGFEVQAFREGRTYLATQKGKENIEFHADGDKQVYAVYHVWVEGKQLYPNMTQAIKFA